MVWRLKLLAYELSLMKCGRSDGLCADVNTDVKW